MYLILLEKLVSWKFYVEELAEIYFKQFKVMINLFLTAAQPSKIVIETLKPASAIITFDSLYLILSELDCSQIKSFLSLWDDSDIPINCIESSILASFPENDVLIFLEDKGQKITFNESCKAILKEKSNNFQFDITMWKPFIEAGDNKLDPKPNYSHSPRLDYESIRGNIESQAPTDIAFGMYCLRQKITENSNSNIDSILLNSLIDCLFHDESFVYMNSIKTCVCIGKIDPAFVCDSLIKTAESRISADNSHIMLRFVEIFDCLLLDLKDNSSLSPWTELFSKFCVKFIPSDIFELKCSIINYYINVIVYDYVAFIKNQKSIWDSFNLRYNAPLNCNLEAEAFFKLIDAYLNLIESEGRNLTEDSILLELNDFLRRSLSSASTSISTMAHHNILSLEKIRTFK